MSIPILQLDPSAWGILPPTRDVIHKAIDFSLLPLRQLMAALEAHIASGSLEVFRGSLTEGLERKVTETWTFDPSQPSQGIIVQRFGPEWGVA